ncbi:MAG TPA: DUF4286 family protein [Pyrinomonadaceae bacterium]|jgi:hypothetical protein
MSQTVIYEITAVVNSELVEAFEKYMRERHIPDLLATTHFRAARLLRTTENRYRIIYEAHDLTALDQYLKIDAVRLRDDFKAHFSEGIELSREIWEVLETWQIDEETR